MLRPLAKLWHLRLSRSIVKGSGSVFGPNGWHVSRQMCEISSLSVSSVVIYCRCSRIVGKNAAHFGRHLFVSSTCVCVWKCVCLPRRRSRRSSLWWFSRMIRGREPFSWALVSATCLNFASWYHKQRNIYGVFRQEEILLSITFQLSALPWWLWAFK